MLIFDIIAKNDELPILRYLGEAVCHHITRMILFETCCLLDEDVEALQGHCVVVLLSDTEEVLSDPCYTG